MIEKFAQSTPGDFARKEQNKEQDNVIIQRMIHYLKPFLSTLGGRGIDIVFSSGVKTLAFDHERGAVIINLDFFREAGLDFDEIVFCLAHEIGHLIQLTKDPEGYLRIFEFIEKLAEEKATNDEEREILRQIYHSFFNVLLDINDNKIIEEQIVPYHPQEGSKANVPANLYKTKLFPPSEGREIPDYSKEPYYAQFLNYILRKIMTNEESEISPEVKNILNEKILVYGEEITIEEFIRNYIQPTTFLCRDILLLAKQFLWPIFEKLIIMDIEAGTLRPAEVIRIIDGPNSRETAEKLKEVAEKVIEKERESKKPSGEKLEEFGRKLFEDNLKKMGFSQHEINTLLEIKEACKEEVDNLAKVWHSFMREVDTIIMEKVTRQKWGQRVNIPDLVLQWPKLLTNPQELEVMERNVPTLKKFLLPKSIKIVLVLDLSESMTEAKRLEVQKVAYTIAQSLKKFKEEVLSQFRGEAIEEEVIETQVDFIGFGSSTQELPFEKSENEEKDFYQAILDIKKNLGGTKDAPALSLALEKFTPKDFEKIEKGELLAIILEITDGETQTAEESKEKISQINERGIFCRGIQIPGDILAEIPPEEIEKRRIKESKPLYEIMPTTGTFAEVWGDKGLRIDHISQLNKIVSQLLQEAIKNYTQNL